MCDAQQFDSETYWAEQFQRSQAFARQQRLENLEQRVQELEQRQIQYNPDTGSWGMSPNFEWQAGA